MRIAGFVRAAVVGALTAAPPAFGAADSPTAPAPGRVPDLSHYDCTALAGTAAKNALHIGQVITGRYYEWNEIYAVGSDGQHLLCISLTVPQAQQLDADQAKTFLGRSAAIGVPGPGAAPANPTERDQAVEPDNVKPEPPKRLLPRKPPNQPDTVPPVPAEHRADDPQAPVPPAPAPTPPVEKPRAADQSAGVAAAAPAEPRQDVTASAVSDFPFNTVGYLTVTYPNGESYRCSGTLVSPYVVLTAGHCIHNNDRGGWVTKVRFYPAQSAPIDGAITRPYGSNSNLANLKATQHWTEISGPDSFSVDDYRYDYAAIQFSTPFTYTSTFMPVVYGSTGSPANNSGYPDQIQTSTADQYGQFFMSGDETGDSIQSLRPVDVREFEILSTGGDSGSPFWVLDGSGRRGLVGSLSYGADSTDEAGGPWYDSWNQALLSSWISWTPTASATGLPLSGLRVGEILASTAQTGQSYLRFYNAGSTSNTVTITLASAATGTPLAQWVSPEIPAGASPQFDLATIESGATPSFTKPALYSLSIQTTMTGFFQHVLWHVGDGSLTNLSTCNGGPTSIPQGLMNVHSSLLSAGYPSTVIVFNTGTTAAPAMLGLYDAVTGMRRSTYGTTAIPPNGQLSLPIGTIEAGARLSPGNLYHYVIKFETQYTGYLQHLVDNTQTGVTTDMTAVCAFAG